jgi:hypothetical protein
MNDASIDLPTPTAPGLSPGPRLGCMVPRWLLLGLLSRAAGIPVAVRGQPVLTNGLVAHYRLQGNADDSWGGLNGELIGNVMPTADRFGQSGMACHFDGTGFGNVPDATQIHLRAMTISLWVRFDTLTGTVDLVNKDDWGQGFQLFTIGSQVVFSIGDGSWHSTEGNASVMEQQWQHLAATYDLQSIRLYVNGVSTDHVDYATTPTYANNSLQFARNGAAESQYLLGDLSDLRFYDRALAPDEVQQLYAYEASRRPSIAVRSSANGLTLHFSDLTEGNTYQVQASGNLTQWSDEGAAFTATGAQMIHPQPLDTGSRERIFLRLVK